MFSPDTVRLTLYSNVEYCEGIIRREQSTLQTMIGIYSFKVWQYIYDKYSCFIIMSLSSHAFLFAVATIGLLVNIKFIEHDRTRH